MSILMYFLYILLAIVVLLFMVMIHELGHYIAGKILKFKINEFSIGFGKAIFSHTSKKTGEKFSIRIFPLGGYCAFAGDEDDKQEAQKGDFNSQAPWKRIIVFLAGIFMNFMTAVVFSLILLCTYGGLDLVQVKKIDPSYTSLSAVQEGDVIYKVEDKNIDIAYGYSYNDLIKEQLQLAKAYDEAHPTEGITGYTFSITVKHQNGEWEKIDGIHFYELIEKNDAGKDTTKYVLGWNLEYYVHSFLEALGRCWGYAIGLAWMVLKSLWLLITFQLPISSMGGPITAITTMATGIQSNPGNILVLIPLLSANLAIFNLLPFPSLDGSHVLFTLIEWIRRKPINRKVENMIHSIGLIILFAFVIIVDILHFIPRL